MLINAGWNSLGTLCAILISFFSAPILIEHLGTSQYGTLLLIGSLTGVLGVMNYGIGEATLRFVAHHHGRNDHESVNRVLGSTLTFYAAVCVCVSTIMIGGAATLANSLNITSEAGASVAWLVRLSAISFSLGMITSAYAVIPAALQRFDISNKVSIVINTARTGGYIALAMAGFGLTSLLIWDVALGIAALATYAIVMQRLLPTASLLPSLSFAGLREIFGYSLFTILTSSFLAMYRESGKLIVGSRIGPSGVAFLGTPDNVVQRLFMIVNSGIETLVPKFSANQDDDFARHLVINATWASIAFTCTVIVPLAALMPQFLSVWINPEFSRESALVGQCIALSLISNAAFTPAATFFRGAGRPWIVTLVIGVAGIAVFGLNLALVPSYGVNGVGYAYLVSSLTWLVGLFGGWIYAFGGKSALTLARVVCIPIAVASLAFVAQTALAQRWAGASWRDVIGFGALFAVVNAVALLGTELLSGRSSPVRPLLLRIGELSGIMSVVKQRSPRTRRGGLT